MIHLDFDGTQFVITGDTELDRVSVTGRDGGINGAKAAGAKRWFLPASVPTFLDAQAAVEDDGGTITPAAQAWWEGVQPAIKALLALKDETRYEPTQLGGFTLRPEQEADATFLCAVGTGAIYHPMRLGKTPISLRVLSQLDKWPVLIAVKPKTILGYEKQIRKALPDRTVAVLKSGMTVVQRRKELEKGADIVLIAHNLLELHSRIFNYGGLSAEKRAVEREKGKYEDKELNEYGFRVVMVDEAHETKNPKAAVTRAAWVLGDDAEHRFVLTGTPAPNKVTENWSALRLCYPKLFPAFSKWASRYVKFQKNYAGFDVPDGWLPRNKWRWDLILDLMSVRRERISGPRIAPPRLIPVELDKPARKLYDNLAKEGMTFLGNEFVAATDNMTLRHRLVQFASGTPIVAGGKVKGLSLPSAKVDALLDVIDESDEKAIVVCESRLLADLAVSTLRDSGVKTVTILGGQSVEESAAAEEAIQEGSAKVIVISKSGSAGIELSKATRTIFIMVSEDLTFNEQASQRNTSDAQESDVVEIIYIYAKGTIDESIQESYVRKDANFHENMRDKNWTKRALFGDTDA